MSKRSIGQRIAKIGPTGTTYTYLNDHLGSARRMVGNYWSGDYYPYGEIAVQSGSDQDTRYDYPGHERDRGTGLVYASARCLDCETGRWISVEPLAELSPERSPYSYARNNPTNFVDPSGLRELPDESWECQNDQVESGDWCYSDRINQTKRWIEANIYNLERERYGEYKDPSQRAAFYQWFFQAVEEKGHGVYWPAGAAYVASQIAFMWENSQALLAIGIGLKNPALSLEMIAFGAAANEEIFNNAFAKMAALYSGSAILTGNAASVSFLL